ncbi:MAG: trimethylamine methyltransferase family protein [Desulfobacterales bacterium]|jgi:trimethylamine--corrinoid protein Co-methyltransferase
MMSTRTNQTINQTAQFRILSPDQKQRIFEGMIETLRDTGVHLHHKEARALLKEHGALIDDITVRIPQNLILDALATVPPVTIVQSWDGTRKTRIEKNQVLFGPGPTPPNYTDPDTLERRKYVRNDASVVARVCEALPNIGFVQSLGTISDVTVSLADAYEFAEMIQNTTKPILSWSYTRDTCSDIHQIAIAMAGSEEAFKRCPNYVFYGEPISPLLSDFHAMDKLMYNAEHGIPQVYTPCCIGGATVPATHAGQLVCAFSESMLGVVVAQLLNPGTCVIMGGVQSIMDMQYSVYAYGSPELSLMSAALTEMAQYAGLPMFSTAGCTDTKTVDVQGAIEAATSVHSAMLSGANFIHDVGYFESGMTGSVLQLVMADEQIGMSHVVAKGIEVNDQTLAVEEICQVGPGGDYSKRDHTQKHAAALWSPTLMDRQRYEDWAEQGQTTMRERVIAKARDIIANFEGPIAKVPPEAKKKIEDILQAAEEREAKKAAAEKKAG